jgi:Uncharacterized enzyme involved in biosynthesis of extracellular polysaccharides
MSSVTMFSIVEVGAGDDERFIQFFKEIRAYFLKQPGFITNQLFRSQAATNRRFLVMGKWESSEALQAATMSDDWNKLMSGHRMKLNPLPFEEIPLE